jgi:hypothetical protein
VVGSLKVWLKMSEGVGRCRDVTGGEDLLVHSDII